MCVDELAFSLSHRDFAKHNKPASVVKKGRTSGWGHDEALGLDTYCENIIICSRGEFLRRHQASLGLDKELALLVSLFYAVRDFSIRSIITVWCNDPIHRVSPRGSLFLWLLPHRELNLVDLLQEQRPVVVLIEDLDNHTDSGGFRGNAVISNGDLCIKNKDFRQRRIQTEALELTTKRQILSHALHIQYLLSLQVIMPWLFHFRYRYSE